MLFFYNISLAFFRLVLHLMSPFHTKAKQMIEGRRQVWSQLAEADKTAEYLWVHCASLGEFEQGRPIIEQFKAENSDAKILLTFFSPSGYEIRKNYEGADMVVYLPFDSKRNAKRLLSELNITKAIFVKYEFWYYYMTTLKANGVSTYIVSAIFREKQAFFKWYGGLYRRILACYTKLFVQDEKSKTLLASVGVDNVEVAGDTRFDRVADIVKSAKDLPEIAQFKNGKKVVVCGSTWPKDEEFLAQYINADASDTKYIIAAHEVHESHIVELCARLSVSHVRYTQYKESDLAAAKVLVVDTIGILSSVYRYGEMAYIGGGFGVGIHNTLEAATYGLPVVFGPNYIKFKEAVDMVTLGAAFSIADYTELKIRLDVFLSDEAILKSSADIAAKYVEDHTGATAAILSLI